MRVLELLEEIEEIVDTAAGFPLTGKIMVDSQELLEIVREIRAELPDEIQQAQWIKNERERIIAEAKTQYEAVIDDAQKQADTLVENNDITVKAKFRAEYSATSRERWNISALYISVKCSQASKRLSMTSTQHLLQTGTSSEICHTERRWMERKCLHRRRSVKKNMNNRQ